MIDQNPIQLQTQILSQTPNRLPNSAPQKDEFHKVWNAEKVAECEVMMETYGECPGGHPFHAGDPHYRAEDIIYEYSESELIEISKCAKDVVYFANTYCYAMTDDGIQKITLRPYQEKVLRSFQANRFSVFLASRQIGKCFFGNTLIKIKYKGDIFEIPIYLLFYKLIKKTRKLTFLEHLKILLYKTQSKLIYSQKYNQFKTFEL